MSAIYRFLGITSFENMNEALAKLVQELEVQRNKIRKDSLDLIESLELDKDPQKVKKIMIDMNRDLTTSYEKERFLLEFINMLKS